MINLSFGFDMEIIAIYTVGYTLSLEYKVVSEYCAV